MRHRIWPGLWLVPFIFLFAGPAAAQSNEIEGNTSVTYAFGQSMTFELTAVSPTIIEQAILFISAPELPNTLSVIVDTLPSREIEAAYALNLGQVQLAPFTTVTYWWQLQSGGEETALPKQSLVYADDQFEWRTAEEDNIRVSWTGDDPGLGQLGLDIVSESWLRLARIVPVSDSAELNIYIYPSAADLRSALRLTGRDWVGAHAHPELGVILVTAVNNRTAASELRQSIPHELTHFLLYQAAGPNYETIPEWFGEGLATFVESSANPSYETVLETAVLENNTIPFTALCQQFPTVEQRTLLAYAQSGSFIEYIQGRFGSQALRELTAVYTDGIDCETGTNRVLQESLDDLNQDWLRSLQPQPPILEFWQENGFWLLLLTGGFGLMSLLVIKRPQR
jgi:predicted SprT family Zn-dependent metalloprotease